MTHLSEDEQLQHALDLEDDLVRRAEAAAHITSCRPCAEQLERIRGDLTIISGIRPTGHPQLLPQRFSPHSVRLMLGAAALVVLSFAAGYLTSGLVERRPASVVPSTLVPGTPDPSHATEVRSDATLVTYPHAARTTPGIR